MKVMDARKFVLSPAEPTLIVPLPKEELQNTRKELIKDIFNYNNLTGQKYQKFIHKFIRYTAGNLGVDGIKVIYDSSLQRTDGFHEESEQTVGFGKFLFYRPSYPEKFFDFLNTIIHEFAHCQELNMGVYTYKKFKNEDSSPIRIDVSDSISCLTAFFENNRQRNLMQHYATSSYYMSPWELYARDTANKEMGKFLIDAHIMLKSKELPANHTTYDLLKKYSNQQKQNTQDERWYQYSSKKYMHKKNLSFKSTKESVNEIINLVTSTRNVDPDVISNLIPLFFCEDITTQQQLDKLYNYMLNEAMRTDDDEISSCLLCNALLLTNTKLDKKAQTHFETIYKVADMIDKTKFPDTLNKCQYDTMDYLIKYGFFTIEPELLEKEYLKYHTKNEFEEFSKLQKQKEKEEEEKRLQNQKYYENLEQ